MIHVIDCISIHSTTRVETWGTYLRRNGFRNFNPLHHEGGDNKHFSQPFNRYNFNPLHHEGGDLIQSFVSFCFLLFQSTPPRGWRPNPNSVRLTSASFQSTPPRGWRLAVAMPSTTSPGFQSTPPRGWRRIYNLGLINYLRISIHSTTRVETFSKDIAMAVLTISIHSTTRVETFQPPGCSRYALEPFQSTPPRGWRPYFSLICS